MVKDPVLQNTIKKTGIQIIEVPTQAHPTRMQLLHVVKIEEYIKLYSNMNVILHSEEEFFLDQIAIDISKVGFPAIIKPISMCGGFGVKKLDSLEDLEEYLLANPDTEYA